MSDNSHCLCGKPNEVQMPPPPYSADDLEKILHEQLETTYVKAEDNSDGCGAKFNCIIVSPKFENVPLLQRHRMVNTALAEPMKSIHALTMKTLTPDQWAKQQ